MSLEKKIKIIPFVITSDSSVDLSFIEEKGEFYSSDKECIYNTITYDNIKTITVAKSRYSNIPAVSNNELNINNIVLNDNEMFSDIFYIYVDTEKLYGMVFSLIGRNPINVAKDFFYLSSNELNYMYEPVQDIFRDEILGINAVEATVDYAKKFKNPEFDLDEYVSDFPKQFFAKKYNFKMVADPYFDKKEIKKYIDSLLYSDFCSCLKVKVKMINEVGKLTSRIYDLKDNYTHIFKKIEFDGSILDENYVKDIFIETEFYLEKEGLL